MSFYCLSTATLLTFDLISTKLKISNALCWSRKINEYCCKIILKRRSKSKIEKPPLIPSLQSYSKRVVCVGSTGRLLTEVEVIMRLGEWIKNATPKTEVLVRLDGLLVWGSRGDKCLVFDIFWPDGIKRWKLCVCVRVWCWCVKAPVPCYRGFSSTAAPSTGQSIQCPLVRQRNWRAMVDGAGVLVWICGFVARLPPFRAHSPVRKPISISVKLIVIAVQRLWSW